MKGKFSTVRRGALPSSAQTVELDCVACAISLPAPSIWWERLEFEWIRGRTFGTLYYGIVWAFMHREIKGSVCMEGDACRLEY